MENIHDYESIMFTSSLPRNSFNKKQIILILYLLCSNIIRLTVFTPNAFNINIETLSI